MLVHLYTGSLGLVARSGVGQAVLHQKAMLESAGVTVTSHVSRTHVLSGSSRSHSPCGVTSQLLRYSRSV